MTVKNKVTTKKSKVCTCCNIDKELVANYYLASDDFVHSDGRVHICKECFISKVDYNNVDSLIDMLRRIDRPFMIALYENSKKEKNPLGIYMKNIAMPQNLGKTYMDSQFNEKLEKYVPKDEINDFNSEEIKESIKFKVTPDLIIKWGERYSEAEIFQLEEFYKRMERANSISTPQLRENLKVLCKLNLKQNNALDEDNHAAFKNLNTQYANVLKDSGFRPIDKQGSNETVGIRSFSQIWEEIEKDGFIPKHKVETTQEIVDDTILHMENYTRRFLNMQTVSEPTGETPSVMSYE